MIEIHNFNFKISSSRLIPILEQPFNKTKSNKDGINLYNKFFGFILNILGYAIKLKANKSIYYVNKNSLIGWMNAQLNKGDTPFNSPEKLQECLNKIKDRKQVTTPSVEKNEPDPTPGQPKKMENMNEKFKSVADLFKNRKPLEVEAKTQKDAPKPTAIPDQNQHKNKMSVVLQAIQKEASKPGPVPKPKQTVQLKPVENPKDNPNLPENALLQAHAALELNPKDFKVQIGSNQGCYIVKGDHGTPYSQHEPHGYVELLSNGIDYNKISPSFKAKITQQEFSRMVNVHKNFNSPSKKTQNKARQVQGPMHAQLNRGKKECVIFLPDIKMAQKISKENLREYEQKTLEAYRTAFAFAVNNNYTSIQMPRIGISKLNLQQANQHRINWNNTVEQLFLKAANEYINKGQLKECILVISDN